MNKNDIPGVIIEKAEADEIINRHNKKDCCHKFVHLRNHNWHYLLLPVLFAYVALVAASAEVSVICRINKEESDLLVAQDIRNAKEIALEISKINELITFFAIEVFAFVGVMMCLFIWLTMKFLLNSFYVAGPMQSFCKTSTFRPRDTLLRNFKDVQTFIGLTWTLAINFYIGSQLHEGAYMLSKSAEDYT